MIAMRVMQMAVHQVANMVAVGYGFVAATRPVYMSFLVPAAVVVRRAALGICV